MSKLPHPPRRQRNMAKSHAAGLATETADAFIAAAAIANSFAVAIRYQPIRGRRA